MVTRQKTVDRGAERGLRLLIDIGREIRQARRDRGLSLRVVGAAVGCSASEVSRIERGLVEGAALLLLARLAAVVGLDLSARCFAGGQPIRDLPSVELLGAFAGLLHPLLRWSTEVPVAGGR